MARQFSGALLKQHRLVAGLRPEPVAVAAGRSFNAYRHYEAGRAEPPASVLAALADALGIEMADLFTDEREAVEA